MHPLIADGGEMTVLRDLAAFSYGRWSVDWPESVPDEQRPELPDDRDFGYASKLKQDPGRLGRRFVRADVDITAQDFDGEGTPIPFTGESNVEETLDDTSRRTEGDVFFEREITRAGLGALQPRVDFDVDSVVPVLIWGKTIPSPVTSIEDVVEAGAVVDYRVHVGGQLLQDDAARERANRAVEATIAQERRERVKAVSKERKARRAAVSAESDARRADVAQVRGVLTGGGERQADLVASLEGLNRQLQGGGEAPAPGLIPAYLQMNTRLWQMQREINAKNEEFKRLTERLDAQQTEQIEQLTAVQKQLVEESSGRIRELMATPAGTSDPNIPATARNDGEDGWKVAIPDVVKGGLFHAQWYQGDPPGGDGEISVEPTYQVVKSMKSNFASYILGCSPSTKYLFVRWATLTKRQITVDKSAGGVEY